jgi:hypothetical protein
MTLVVKKPTGGKLVLSKIQQYPAVLGEAWGGGYFAGYISHAADGNPTHALIVAPRATGATGTGYTVTTNLQWKIANTTTTGTTSDFDGVANTAAIVTAGINDHPAAQFCVGLSVGGFTDWYFPSRYEMDIAYFNLKPTTAANSIVVSAQDVCGVNPYSVPKRSVPNTAIHPPQTGISAFAGGLEAFAGNIHHTSTQFASNVPWTIDFSNGAQNAGALAKTNSARVRAFRRIAL